MDTPSRITTRQASSTNLNAHDAIAELKTKIALPDPKLVMLFCTADFDMVELGKEVGLAWSCPVIGCTSAGQVDKDGFSASTISALCISGPLSTSPYLIDLANMENGVRSIVTTLAATPKTDPQNARFGFLLMDGLQRKEESLASMLYQELPALPFVGGSAGDNMKLQHTYVYYKGQFIENAATFCVFETALPYAIIKFEHYQPTAAQLIVTEADPEKRVIYEFDGEPAAEVYARTIGTTVNKLGLLDYIANPLMLPLGHESFLRDIQGANPDGSLSLFCAIETGVVLSIGKSTDSLQKAQKVFGEVEGKIGKPAFIIGCDCAHRKLDFETHHLAQQAGELYASHKVFGFSTYGEQYNGIHINQTFTGIAIGQ